jgi:hypothetical protein
MMPAAKKLKENPEKQEKKSFFSELTASLAPSSWFKAEKVKNSHKYSEIPEEEEMFLPSK